MPRTPDPKSKAGFVRSLPTSTPAAEVVAKAKAKGLAIDARYVYSVRTASRAKVKPAATAATTKRGPGRPRKTELSVSSETKAHSGHTRSGLEAEVERIVERKVAELLKSRLGSLFG